MDKAASVGQDARAGTAGPHRLGREMQKRDMQKRDTDRGGMDDGRSEFRATWLVRILALGLVILPGLAQAAPLDVRFDKFYDASSTATTRVQNDQIKLLMREIGLAIGPRSSGPVYSQGALGMDAAVEYSTSGAKADNDYWKKAVDSPQSSLSSWVIRARKGMPQSVQLGASLTHLQDSNLYAAGVDFQASLIDGFRYVPDFGVRGSVSGVVGNSKMDFLNGAVDVTVSKNFGIMGVLSLQPWLAWSPGFMYVKPNLEPILPNDKSLKMVLPKFDNVTAFTQRASIGLRVVSYRVQVGVELIRSFTDDLNLITGKIGAVF